MPRYAILLGSAPEDFRQKKIEDMFNFLDSKRNKGDSIVTFANGISEMMLEMVMDNSVKLLTNAVVEPVETTSYEAISEKTQICHSELVSESTCKQALKHPSVAGVRSERSVQGDGKRQVQHDSHSDLDSKFTNARHSEAKPKNLLFQEMFRSAQHNGLLLYICTLRSVAESEESFWLGGEEIRRDVILHYQTLAAECRIDMQVIFDFDSELVSEEELGWENVDSLGHSEKQNRHSEFISESIGEIDK